MNEENAVSTLRFHSFNRDKKKKSLKRRLKAIRTRVRHEYGSKDIIRTVYAVYYR